MSHSHQMPDNFNSTAPVIKDQCIPKEGSKPLDAKDHLTPIFPCTSGTATPVVSMYCPGQAHNGKMEFQHGRYGGYSRVQLWGSGDLSWLSVPAHQVLPQQW